MYTFRATAMVALLFCLSPVLLGYPLCGALAVHCIDLSSVNQIVQQVAFDDIILRLATLEVLIDLPAIFDIGEVDAP